MAKIQLGNPNVIILDIINNEQYFIDELIISSDVIFHGDDVVFEDLILYWRTDFNTARSPIKLVSFHSNPSIFEIVVSMVKRNFVINFTLEEIDYSSESHKKAVATAVFEQTSIS